MKGFLFSLAVLFFVSFADVELPNAALAFQEGEDIVITLDPSQFVPHDEGYFISGVFKDLNEDGIDEFYNGCYDAYGDADHRESGMQNGWEYGNVIIFRGCDLNAEDDVIKGVPPSENWPAEGNIIQLGKHYDALTDSARFSYLISPSFQNLTSLTVKVGTDVSINPYREIFLLIEASTDDGATWEYMDNEAGTAFIYQQLTNQGGDVLTYSTTLGDEGFDAIAELSTQGPIKLRFTSVPPLFADPSQTNGERLKIWGIEIGSDAALPNAPEDLAISASTIDEGLPVGSLVGELSSAYFKDVVHMYSLVSGEGDTDNSSFIVDGHQLLSNEIFDFEKKSKYTVRIRVADTHGGAISKAFSITISDIEENSAPSAVLLSNLTIQENQTVGTEVGTLSTEDTDIADEHIYTLLDSADHNSFSIDQSTLVSAEVFDFETKPNYTIYVRSADNEGEYVIQKFVIEIENLDEPEPLSLDQTNSFAIYPNPLQDSWLTVEASGKPIDIQILDIEGRVVYDGSLLNHVNQINLPNLKRGLYFIRLVKDEEVLYNRKLIVRD